MWEQINREEKLFVEKRKIGNNSESKLGLGGSVGSGEQLRGICSTLSTFGSGERDNFEGCERSSGGKIERRENLWSLGVLRLWKVDRF